MATASWTFSWPTTTARICLFHNLGGKKFEEVAFQAGVAYNEDGNALAGMGADFRDVNNDGLPDIWHTAIENETFPLFLNRGGGQFGNADQTSRLARITREMSGWSNGDRRSG